MMWETAFDRFTESDERIKRFSDNALSFGVNFLDKALLGINQHDLVLVGAPSGMGKTGFVTNLALTNVLNNKRVHVMALEAYQGEIEDRIRFKMFAEHFYKDPMREPFANVTFRDFIHGKINHHLANYREQIAQDMQKLVNLKTLYRQKDFTVDSFKKQAFLIAPETDLIIIDHLHYFDIEDDNENKGMKEIVKTIKWISDFIEKPIILVAHLRKRDRKFPELAAGMDEFHGSSDITKIATKIITMGKGDMITPSRCETYLRIPKNRIDGSVTFYVAKLLFDFKRNQYDPAYTLGKLENMGSKFTPLTEEQIPKWMK